jgi:hypothetical protein
VALANGWRVADVGAVLEDDVWVLASAREPLSAQGWEGGFWPFGLDAPRGGRGPW